MTRLTTVAVDLVLIGGLGLLGWAAGGPQAGIVVAFWVGLVLLIFVGLHSERATARPWWTPRLQRIATTALVVLGLLGVAGVVGGFRFTGNEQEEPMVLFTKKTRFDAEAGRLTTPQLRLPSRQADCVSNSSVSGRSDAYACDLRGRFAYPARYDPCFGVSFFKGLDALLLACFEGPWIDPSGGDVSVGPGPDRGGTVTVEFIWAASVRRGRATPRNEVRPWALELTGERKCVRVLGDLDDERKYACYVPPDDERFIRSPNWLVGFITDFPNTDTEPWTVPFQALTHTGDLASESVVEAWS